METTYSELTALKIATIDFISPLRPGSTFGCSRVVLDPGDSNDEVEGPGEVWNPGVVVR